MGEISVFLKAEVSRKPELGFQVFVLFDLENLGIVKYPCSLELHKSEEDFLTSLANKSNQSLLSQLAA